MALMDILKSKLIPDAGPITVLERSGDDRMISDNISTPNTGYSEINAWVDAPSQTAVAIDTRDATNNIAAIMEKETVEGDPVNKPNHYCKGGFELGEILYVWGLPHRRASAVEYIMRAGDKDPAKEIEDLRKSIRNIEMEIEYLEKYGKI